MIHIVFLFYIPYNELSIIHGYGDIFDENCREKEEGKNTWKNILEKPARSQCQNATNHCQFIYEIYTFYLEKLLKTLSQKITVLNA